MTDSTQQGPGNSILNLAKQILQQLTSMAESRLQLITIELEEEKAFLTKLLLIAGVSLICFAFSLLSLIALIFLAIDPAYRIMVLSVITAILFLIAAGCMIITIRLSQKKTLLAETKQQLKQDLELLSGTTDNESK